ncbi:MAG TPA: DUF3427 domain-containing protein [Clostridiales bacterium]|nr:DUF3427 domain-containing protein [Clostridiales bacterium]
MDLGLYEKLLDSELKNQISELHNATRKVDSSETARVLATAYYKILRKILSEKKDEEKIEFVEKLNKEIGNEILFEGEKNFLEILAVHDDEDVLKKLIRDRPKTSISSSTLFTGYNGPTLESELRREIRTADRIDFIVSFIKYSGLVLIYDDLAEFTRTKKLRIITTSYMGASDYKAILRLSQLPNTEIKISYDTNRTRLHAKAYYFERNTGFSTAYIGSSNISNPALSKGLEWNLKVSEYTSKDVVDSIIKTFETYWNDDEFRTFSPRDEEDKKELKKALSRKEKDEDREYVFFDLRPFSHQKEILEDLRVEREEYESYKNLVVAATGTGKTYLSAFDVRNFAPKKMLFLVHRDRLLDQAIESYKDVLGEDIRVGKLSSNSTIRDYEADYLFASMATMAKEEHRLKYRKDYFDYIIIDETHRAAADSYQKILSYFEPKFLLGMTATPELSDGRDIYGIYDNNIAYEIRLQQAMENDLLCPFHYFGISELKIDDVTYKDNMFKDVFSYLTSSERINHIIDNINYYGYSGDRVHGLIFCRRIEEADELSRLFNERGYQTMVVSSKSDMIYQGKKLTIDNAIDLLEQDEREGGLDYIFTVDMFNEGVDIPNVNQVVMLRPTDSPIVFVQQLGRGLRKADGKEYVVVLDFIGNYANNFMIPIALSGDRSYNKDNLRKYILEGTRVIPGCSTIHFNAIAKERIFNSINNIKGVKKIIKESYKNLKFKLGHIPSMIDFYDNGEIDPLLILNEYKSYFNFLKKVEEEYKDNSISDTEMATLEYLSKTVARGKRPHELIMLKYIVDLGYINRNSIVKELEEKYNLLPDGKSLASAISTLEGEFVSNELEKEKYSHMDILIEKNDGFYERVTSFTERIRNLEFRKQLNDIIELGIRRYNDFYHSENNRREEFVLYQKYSRRDVCWLLNWEKDYSSTMYGMKRIKDDVVVFVTYDKSSTNDDREYIDGKPDYADEFLKDSNQIFMWESQIGKGPESSYMQDVMESKNKHLFIKKSDAEGTDFYYMGMFDIAEIKGSKKKDNNGKLRDISKVKFKLHDPVREDIRDYLESYI